MFGIITANNLDGIDVTEAVKVIEDNINSNEFGYYKLNL